jgi:hypothetical protein
VLKRSVTLLAAFAARGGNDLLMRAAVRWPTGNYVHALQGNGAGAAWWVPGAA